MVSQKYRWDFIGLSTDDKPTSETSDKVVNGSTYYCSDTSKLYVYCDGAWYERKSLGGGGGGGTSDFNDLTNRPKYNGSDMTGSTNIPEVKTYTAGSNVAISDQNVISATDTTYSAFTGTDGTAAGVAGLVPAPATTDAGKYLKADGTWDTVQAGPTVVQTTGTSTTDVMSQNATTSMVFADPSTKYQVQIGNNAVTSGAGATSIGGATRGTGNYSVAIGNTTRTTGANSVALGSGADASQKGQFDISTSFSGNTLGYNDTQYRLLTGLYDGQSEHDAATKGQLDSIAIQNAGAPTTATVGTVGQLLEDTTNGKLYICTDATNPYVWEEIGSGGGSGPTVVQTTGTSTTDVMSQKAVSDAIYLPGHDPVTNPTAPIVALGYYSYVNPSAKGSFTVGTYNGAFKITRTFDERSVNILGGYCIGAGSITIGIGAENANGDSFATLVGASTKTGGNSTGSSAFGFSARTGASANGAVAVGAYSNATAAGEMNIGSTDTNYGYNSSNYRLLTGLYDGQSDHDAATVGQLKMGILSASPTGTTVGFPGRLYTLDTGGGSYEVYLCVHDNGDNTYVWKQVSLI